MKEGKTTTHDDERDAELLPAVEAALTQIQHISDDGLVDLGTGTTYYVRYLKTMDPLQDPMHRRRRGG